MIYSVIYKIQSIKCPDKCYIGSAVNYNKRRNIHLFHLKRGDHHSIILQRHFNKYGIEDLQFSILLGCDKEDLIKHEQYFIDSYNPYFNVCKKAGSVLGRKMSDETKQKIRLSNLGKKHREFSDETKKRISEALRRRPPISEETRNKLRIAQTGMKYSEETRRKMGEKSKGNKHCLGHKHTEETKLKISKSKKERELKRLESLKIAI